MANGVSTRWRGRETQRARRGEDWVVLCLMLDAFLLLTAAEIWHEHPCKVYLALADPDIQSPGSTWGGQSRLSNSLVSNYHLT